MKFSIKDFFIKCNQIHRKLQIWSHLLKKHLMENFIFLCSARHVLYRRTLRSETIFCSWNPFKIDEKCFSFYVKTLFVLKIFKFFSWLFVHGAKRLGKKDKVNFKFSDVTAWLTNNRDTYILPNISRSKGNQTMKFGQLIECNVRNIFLEKSYRNHNFLAETRPRSFSKK